MAQKIKVCLTRVDGRKLAILIEAVILLGMLVWAIATPVQKLYIGCEDFYAAGIGDGIYDGSTIMIKDAPAQSLSVWGYRLRGGAYEVDVSYRSEIEGNRDYQNAVGAVEIQSGWPIRYSNLELKDQHMTAQERLWIPMGADCRDLRISVWYRGTGMLELERISITEKRIYRYVLIVGAALLFLAINLCYAFFYSVKAVSAHEKGTLLALFGITFAASLPFMTDFLFEAHDLFFHLERIVLLAEEFKYGQFPVRMFTTANNYYGYPSPIFYCDFLLYLPALLYNCMIPLQNCYQIYMILMNAATCAIAYYCFFRITQRRKLSILGTALYVLCTIRLVHFTVRAAVGEYSAMTFLPLILLGMHEIYSKDKLQMRDWFPLSLGMAGIICSHMLTTELIVIDLIVFALLLFPKTFKLDRLAAILKAAGLCMLLCAWFVVPFLDYYLTQDTVIGNQMYFLQRNGTYPIQLLGVFLTGVGYSSSGNMVGTMPLTIGFSLTLGIVVILVCLVNRKNWEIREEKDYPIWAAFFPIAILNLFFTMKCFPWDMIQLRFGTQAGQLGQMIGSIQFPWRWLTPASALLVFCIMCASTIVRNKDSRIYQYSCAAILIALTVSTGYLYQQFSNTSYLQYLHSLPVDKYMDDLYLLKGTDLDAYRWSEASVTEGNAQIQSYYKESGTAYLNVENTSDAPGQVTLPIYGYRHYHALDESGQELPVLIGENNCVSLEIAPGYSGEITVRFIPPLYWRISEAVSLLTAIGLVGMGARRLARHKKKETYNARFS